MESMSATFRCILLSLHFERKVVQLIFRGVDMAVAFDVTKADWADVNLFLNYVGNGVIFGGFDGGVNPWG